MKLFNMLMRSWTTFFLIFLIKLTCTGQNDQNSFGSQVSALNKYVDFINESTHGMFLANRLLIEYNIDINKYVDLESEKINNYSNKDLPKDIFEDKEHWFYEISPYELLTQAKAKSSALNQQEVAGINQACDKLLAIIKKTNQLRLDMDLTTQGIDLNQKANLDKVYLKLEEGVVLFDNYLKIVSEVDKKIDDLRSTYTKVPSTALQTYTIMRSAIAAQKAVMSRVRQKQPQYFDQILSQLVAETAKMKTIQYATMAPAMGNKINFSQANIQKAVDEFVATANSFNKNESIPSKYKYYGRFYYYYNTFVSKFNKYGTGIAFENNQIIHYSKLPLIKFIEQPHIFQVIYPKKVVDKLATKSSAEVLETIPTMVKDRKVSNTKQIRVDNNTVELELFDHMIADGDIVSINFNGDWIMEKEELEKGSKRVKLQLNPTGKNYILLHADSIGKRPPNTTGIRYFFRGEKKDIILKSDNNYSELIEIVVVK
jgi:hypothetical protein